MIIIQDVVFSFIEKLKSATRMYKLIAFAVFACILIAVSVFSSGVKLTYNVILDGKVLANVSSKAVYDEALEIALDKVSGKKGSIEEAELKSVISINEQTDSAKEVSQLILENNPSVYSGYEINVDGKVVGYISDIDVFNTAKAAKLSEFDVEGARCEASFVVNVSADPAYFTLENVSTSEDIESALSGLDVQTVVKTDKTYTVKYETAIQKDASKYAGYQTVLNKGVNGVGRTVTEVTYLNGVAVSDPVTKKEVVEAPIDEVVVVGTKDVYVTSAPQNASSSGFKWPLSILGVETSKFGAIRQNGTKVHGGVDIGVPVGTKVIAVKSGTVVEAKYDKSYGYYVLIDHGNGLKTRYAHNKRNVVSAGQKVSAGQLIALSGNSGYSTGPHLHFEVILNGKKVNPGNYLDLSKIR